MLLCVKPEENTFMKTPKKQLPYIKPRKETAQLLVFSVTPFKIDQNKLIRDVRRNDLPKFIEICMETPCWCSSGMSTNMADGNQQKH